ncbi:MAG: CRTAC1 family protein, partial [Bacteroidota bacterium]
MNKIYILLFALLIIGCSKESDKDSMPIQEQKTVFQKVAGDESGIRFINAIKEDIASIENVFDYDYFYNGSGVGLGDINNDGLLDIVFTANQSANKIYLNKGSLKFEDITQKANINQGKGWSTGVTFADVNADGWLDIYISQGGPNDDASRKNLLFINQKDLTFKEAASEYGLDDASISSQAAFFDYDKDGDLDCIVMNENTLYGTPPAVFYEKLDDDPTLLHHSSSHFYRNEKGIYTDITKESGLLKATFGLGLIVSDINADSWLDVYIANDYYVPDAMYINNRVGGFSDEIEEATHQVSFFGMGVDIADINNDNHQDIFVLDMASADHYRAKTLMASMDTKSFDLLVNDLDLHHQYMFNSFQLNEGNGRFKNMAQLTKLAKTDWSWAVLMSDYDNSGAKDIYVTNGYRRYALDNDTRTKVLQAKRQYRGDVPLEVKRQIYNAMPSEKLSNLLYQNTGNLNFKDMSTDWGVSHPSFSNGAAYGDLDNDGDLELIVSNIDDEAFLYKNLSVENKLGNYLMVSTQSENGESFAKVSIKYNGETQLVECNRVKGYLSSMDHTAHFVLKPSNNCL